VEKAENVGKIENVGKTEDLEKVDVKKTEINNDSIIEIKIINKEGEYSDEIENIEKILKKKKSFKYNFIPKFKFFSTKTRCI
jgi:hypothetical protein